MWVQHLGGFEAAHIRSNHECAPLAAVVLLHPKRRWGSFDFAASIWRCLAVFNAKCNRIGSAVFNTCMNRLVLLVLPRRNVDFDLCRRSQRKQSQNYGCESKARHEGSVTHVAMSGGLCLGKRANRRVDFG